MNFSFKPVSENATVGRASRYRSALSNKCPVPAGWRSLSVSAKHALQNGVCN